MFCEFLDCKVESVKLLLLCADMKNVHDPCDCKQKKPVHKKDRNWLAQTSKDELCVTTCIKLVITNRKKMNTMHTCPVVVWIHVDLPVALCSPT